MYCLSGRPRCVLFRRAWPSVQRACLRVCLFTCASTRSRTNSSTSSSTRFHIARTLLTCFRIRSAAPAIDCILKRAQSGVATPPPQGTCAIEISARRCTHPTALHAPHSKLPNFMDMAAPIQGASQGPSQATTSSQPRKQHICTTTASCPGLASLPGSTNQVHCPLLRALPTLGQGTEQTRRLMGSLISILAEARRSLHGHRMQCSPCPTLALP